MADTASRRSLWTTLGAAAVTIVVILGLAAGPTAVSCASDADGFGTCVRAKLADIGLWRQDPAAVSVPAKSVAVTNEAVPDVAEETAEAEPAATPSEPAENALAPRLGLVRAEPDGSLVIAGSAAPGDEVEIYANGEILGRTTAESSGDWVFVPDATLPAGGVEISVAVPQTGELAAQSVVVVIQDDLKTEPLVVASTPGEASKILQGLPMPEPMTTAPPMLVADVETVDEAGQADDAAAPAAPESAPMEMAAAEMPAAEAADEADEAVATAMSVADPAAEAEAESAAGVDDTTAVAMTNAADNAKTEISATSMVPPTIDAVEVDGARNFFAGGGSEGAIVRLYVDDQFIADTVVKDGRWLIETPIDHLHSPRQRIRVDMLRPGTADVVGRAEVNFEIQLPETGDAVAVADNGAAEAEINATAAAADAGAALTSPPVVGEAADASSQDAAMDVAANDGAMADEAADSDVPTLTAVQVGDPDAQRFASGKAIIRGGDNLWTIASRVYGTGYRYTTIYRANRDQIRNPDLIYPGQVFELPEAD